MQAQLRFEGPARDRMTSVVAFAVDAEKLRTQFIPSVLRDWLASVQQPTGFPHLETEVLDEDGKIFASHPEHTGNMIAVDERSFAIIFFDKELLEFAAPYEAASRNPGACAPATARSRFPRSSAPAPGRNWR